MRRTMVVASMLAGLGLTGAPPGPAAAQTRVIVPIVIQTQRTAPPQSARTPSIHVTTRTASPQPGVTTTRVTVRDTSGAVRDASATATSRTMINERAGPSSSVLVTTRTTSPQPGVTTTRVTVRDTSGAVRDPSAARMSQTMETAPIGASAVLVTVDQRPGPDGTGDPGQTRVTVEDVSHSNRVLGGAAPVSVHGGAGLGQQTLIVTSEAPIDAPIVILTP